ncbi:MAG: 23S rRNA (uracil(1939)-C(5))-methyltransferase RlmD [Bacteroidetes bacterium]|nr:23S rRNA (uracil(1939)-C(5))-methyltransferase RlmD [Bacteroidota bacterium]
MKNFNSQVFEKVEITAAAAEGKSLARVDNRVIFISNAVPGDIADIRITRKQKKFFEGVATNFHRYSEKRTPPLCKHFGLCGGCKWQHLDYQWQLHYKRQQVIDAFSRIGKIQFPEVLPIIGSKEIYNYRNRLDFSFSNKKWLTIEEINSGETFDRNALGFHIPGTFDKVLDLEECHLQGNNSEQIRKFVREFCSEKKYSFFDIRAQHGLMRTLTIRTAHTGEIMVIVQFFENDPEKRDELLSAIAEKFPQITSLMWVVNPKGNDTFNDLSIHTFSGRDHIFEKMPDRSARPDEPFGRDTDGEDLQFKIGPKSFYQTNSAQAYELYKVAREFAGLTGKENVYDLYTGTGTIALFIAKLAKKVTGVELVPAAIADAKENAELNNIKNTNFFAADMKDIFTSAFMAENGKPDVIITDPPRTGMHEDVVRCMADSGAEKVVYVSCNPASQARDLALLDEKYSVEKVQPVDMFPQTHHVENVCLLRKR